MTLLRPRTAPGMAAARLSADAALLAMTLDGYLGGRTLQNMNLLKHLFTHAQGLAVGPIARFGNATRTERCRRRLGLRWMSIALGCTVIIAPGWAEDVFMGE